jgi:hypothetical protein
VPVTRRAAAGANTSRPWNVAAAAGGTGIATTRAPGRSIAGDSTPLSGPTRKRPALATAIA